MNIVLMVSRVTYAPGNYRGLVEECFRIPGCRIAGILVFDNRNFTVFMQGLKLLVAGAKRLGAALTGHWFKSDPKIRIAKKYGIPVFKTSNPHSETCLQWVQNLQPDLLLHARTRCILKPELLQIPRLGAVNIHHGLLPETRGTMCDLRLLLQGKQGGFSLHKMTPVVDGGAVFSRTEVADAMACGKNYWTYLKQSCLCEAQAVRKFLEWLRDYDAFPPALPKPDISGHWYRTPSWAEFRAWRREGWKL
ncbi:MAG: hypothetical protein LBR60_04640 [Fibrobacter sp.]|jgi:hypothetical protein|nr:hypothetical protein [Fibrobacter sp.]